MPHFLKDSQEAVYRPFIDYQSSKAKEGPHFFKRLGKTISQYLSHPEYKFDGDMQVCLREDTLWLMMWLTSGRRRITSMIRHWKFGRLRVFLNIEYVRQKILSISYTDWKNRGYSKGTLHNLKKSVTVGKNLKISRCVRDRLLRF